MALTVSIPASVYASWPKPNYVDPVRRTWMPAFALTWQVVSTLLVAGRLYLRARKQAGSFGLDDLLISIAWIFSVGVTVCTLLDTEEYDLDRHVWDVHPDLGWGAAKVGWCGQVLFLLSTVPTKLSVLLFYRRITRDTIDRRWTWAIYAALAVTASYGVGSLLTYCFTCQPLEATWLALTPTYNRPYKCIDTTSFIISSGILSVVSDCYAVAIPFAMLRKYNLDVPRRQWIALRITFAIGFLVTGAGIGRTYYIYASSHSVDASWVGFDLLAWSVVECQLALVCACVPALRVFFRHYLREPLKRTFDSTSSVSHHPDRSRPSGLEELEKEKDIEIELESGLSCRGRSCSESQDGEKVTTPEEYEWYVKERLSRHGSRARSLLSVRTLFPDFDLFGDDKSRGLVSGQGRDDIVLGEKL